MRKLEGLWKKIFDGLLIVWGFMIFFTIGGRPQHPSIQGYLLFALPAFILCFMAHSARKEEPPRNAPTLPDVILMVASIICCVYPLFRYNEWMVSPAAETTLDLIFSGVFLLIALEAARRSVGRVMSLICLLVLAYTFFGHHIPGMWGSTPMSLGWVLGTLYTTTTGYVGMVTWVISTIVCIYVIAGGILFSCGAGESFIDVSKVIAGRIRGGAGILSVVASGFFGMISGSPVANVATCGNFTIPLMKRTGFGTTFAGAVECAASTGGQIMPPVMGAGAFIMAEMLGIPYVKVCIAAALPAVLYFLGVGMAVYFEARKLNLVRLPKEEMPTVRDILSWRKVGPLAAFITVLLYLLFDGYSPQTSCYWGLIGLVGLFVFTTGKLSLQEIVKRFRLVITGMLGGGRNLINLGCVILCVQIIVSLISLTGIGIKFSELIYSLGASQVLLSLVLAGMISTALGLGLPTTAAYLIGISVLGIGLTKLGLTPLNAHLFVFYYSILSEVTPPVSLSAVVAAGIAEGHFLPIGWMAWRLALPAFVVPFMFAFNPVLLLQGEVLNIIISTTTAFLGIILLSGGLSGYFLKHANIPERVILLASALCLIHPSYVFDYIGLGGTALVIGSQFLFPGWRKPAHVTN